MTRCFHLRGNSAILAGRILWNELDLQQIVSDIANALLALDRSRKPFRQFQPGVGPYGEPQVMRIVAEFLKLVPVYGLVKTKRTPDLLIPGQWAIEVKLARPFGDNGVQAEIGRLICCIRIQETSA